MSKLGVQEQESEKLKHSTWKLCFQKDSPCEKKIWLIPLCQGPPSTWFHFTLNIFSQHINCFRSLTGFLHQHHCLREANIYSFTYGPYLGVVTYRTWWGFQECRLNYQWWYRFQYSCLLFFLHVNLQTGTPKKMSHLQKKTLTKYKGTINNSWPSWPLNKVISLGMGGLALGELLLDSHCFCRWCVGGTLKM